MLRMEWEEVRNWKIAITDFRDGFAFASTTVES
jgi:hypothetical protein